MSKVEGGNNIPENLLNQPLDYRAPQKISIIHRPEKDVRIPSLQRNLFYVNGNGIDIKDGGTSKNKGLGYEIRCFEKITSQQKIDAEKNKEKPSVILGPRFIDYVFGKAFPCMARPDAIKFGINNSSEWIISELYEFKSSINGLRGPTTKLDGFSKLLSEMRKDPSYLPAIFKSSMPWAKEALPKRIAIPADKGLSVVFVSPQASYDKKTLFEREAARFKVDHLYIDIAA